MRDRKAPGHNPRRVWAPHMEQAYDCDVPGTIDEFKCPICRTPPKIRPDIRGMSGVDFEWACDDKDCGAHGRVRLRELAFDHQERPPLSPLA